MTEYKATVTDGFRTEPFEAEVTDLVVKDVSGYNKVIFEFAEGPNLSIFPPKEIVDGIVPGYMDLGILINSLTSLGIETFISVDDDTLTLDGLRTEPDICGKTLSFDVKKRMYVDKNSGEEKNNYEWRVLNAISNSAPLPASAQQPTPTPPQKPAEPTAPAGDDSELLGAWATIIVDTLGDEPKTEAQIMKAMKEITPDKVEQSKLNKVRRKALSSMVESGDIKLDGSKYSMT